MKEKARRLSEGGPHVSIGALTADLLRLGDELALLKQAGAELVHVDVMDGVFFPQMTVGPPFVGALEGPFLKDVHLMIKEPEGEDRRIRSGRRRRDRLQPRGDEAPAPGLAGSRRH